LSGEWVSLANFSRQIGLIRVKRYPPDSAGMAGIPYVAGRKVMGRHHGAAPLYTRMSVDNLIHSNKKIDHSLASAELQFRPRPFSTTLRDTIEWFKQKGALS